MKIGQQVKILDAKTLDHKGDVGKVGTVIEIHNARLYPIRVKFSETVMASFLDTELEKI